jgi:hypothetical protein
MSYSEPDHDVEKISSRLTRAWRFLSGEHRPFELLVGGNDALRFTNFSFFMPIKVPLGGVGGGVGVLLEREDALLVASHMFGVAPAAVPLADLRDACSEVCNVFSDALASHIVGNDHPPMGLPMQVDAQQYEAIARNSVAKAVYRGTADGQSLHVVVYYLPSQPV